MNLKNIHLKYRSTSILPNHRLCCMEIYVGWKYNFVAWWFKLRVLCKTLYCLATLLICSPLVAQSVLFGLACFILLLLLYVLRFCVYAGRRVFNQKSAQNILKTSQKTAFSNSKKRLSDSVEHRVSVMMATEEVPMDTNENSVSLVNRIFCSCEFPI